MYIRIEGSGKIKHFQFTKTHLKTEAEAIKFSSPYYKDH